MNEDLADLVNAIEDRWVAEGRIPIQRKTLSRELHHEILHLLIRKTAFVEDLTAFTRRQPAQWQGCFRDALRAFNEIFGVLEIPAGQTFERMLEDHSLWNLLLEELGAKALSAYKEDLGSHGKALKDAHGIYAMGSLGDLLEIHLGHAKVVGNSPSLWELAKRELPDLIGIAQTMGIPTRPVTASDKEDRYQFRAAMRSFPELRRIPNLDEELVSRDEIHASA